MMIFIHGLDIYRSRQKLNEIIEHYKEVRKSGLNLKYFNGKELDFQKFKEEMRGVSMFKEKKLLVLLDVFSNTVFKENFLKEKENLLTSDNIILFYETEKIADKDPLFLFLKENSKHQEFKPLQGQKLKMWIKKECKKIGANITEMALTKLVTFVGNNLWQLENEIKKLASYKKGKTIEEKDVEILVKPKIESDIFKTIDAIASRNKKRAFELLKAHLEQGESAFYLFSMINFQFRNLLMVKDLVSRNLSPYNLSGLRPYVVRKSYELSKRFAISELKKIYQKIFQIDLAIKTGRIDPQIALDLLIAQI